MNPRLIGADIALTREPDALRLDITGLTFSQIEIRLPTQENLGGWTASSRASITGALKTMRELGWVKTERRRIVVLDLEALSQRAA